MQGSTKALLVAVLSMVAFTLTNPKSSFALPEQITLATGEWAPYTSTKLPGQGFATEIVSAIATEMGFELNVKFFPWSRAKKMVERNKVIGSFPWAVNDERKKKYNLSNNFFNANTKFFYYDNKMKDVAWTRFDDLKEYKIGAVQDYSSREIIQKNGLKVRTIPNEKSGFKLLFAGKIDLFPSVDLVGLEILKNLFPKKAANFGVLEKNLSQEGFSVMCSKTHPDSLKFIKMFNDGLKRIKEKGIYKQILGKYGLRE